MENRGIPESWAESGGESPVDGNQHRRAEHQPIYSQHWGELAVLLRYDSLSEGGHSGQSPVSEDQGSLVQAAQSCELDQTMTEKRKMQMWIQ